MRDVSRKTFQLRHFETKSPTWYAVIMASKLVTSADLNWSLRKLGTPCKHRTLQRNSTWKSIVSIASHPLRMHGGGGHERDLLDAQFAWPCAHDAIFGRGLSGGSLFCIGTASGTWAVHTRLNLLRVLLSMPGMLSMSDSLSSSGP